MTIIKNSPYLRVTELRGWFADNVHCFSALLLLALGASYGVTDSIAQTAAQPVQVLSWWKSAGEHKAVDVLAERLAQENILWHDVVIPSGGVGAGIVLKSRLLAGTAPDMAQLKGPLIAEWFELGLINEFNPVVGGSATSQNRLATAQVGKWDRAFFSTVEDLVRSNGHLLAIPLGIHRMNLIFYNRKVFDKYGLHPPETWSQFIDAATRLQKQGIIPLAQSSEPWQVATLFEALLLSESSPEFYRRAFVRKDPTAFADSRFARALLRLRVLKQYMPVPVRELNWTDTTRLVANGEAAMIVMGDFAKGEFNAWGYATDSSFGCVAVPNTGNTHIYNIDTLVMLKKDGASAELADRIAQILVSPNVQTDYNNIKGSIPVLRNADPLKMDSCARESWKVFARGAAVQVPSLAHDMATDGISKDAIIEELVHFFKDDTVKIVDAQHRLGVITRSLPKAK